jgi:hypothetical protein
MRPGRRLGHVISASSIHRVLGQPTRQRQQLVGHEYGRVVLVPVHGVLTPVAEILFHGGAFMHCNGCYNTT